MASQVFCSFLLWSQSRYGCFSSCVSFPLFVLATSTLARKCNPFLPNPPFLRSYLYNIYISGFGDYLESVYVDWTRKVDIFTMVLSA